MTRRRRKTRTPTLVRRRDLGRAFARGRSPSLFFGSFDTPTAIVRFIQRGLLQLNFLAVFGDVVFNPVLNILVGSQSPIEFPVESLDST